ncbi:cytochrome c551 [Lederbergia lenta]|uniref:cytochrome c551 n=1 Tax=Lederbergia lenta TaxID=1467 RepID=UPI00203EA606|nr:cytochrome c [Lederbergia lenta]MCM3113105.1 cytochrome c [Lederbergia lenta]
MKKKLLGLMMGATLAIILTACGGGGNNSNENAGESVSDAEAIVNKSCISCHGENLEGRNGPALDKIGATLDKDEILDVIANGRPGMPKEIIKGDDAEKVAEWLAEKK